MARGGHTAILVENNLLIQGGQQHISTGFKYFSLNPAVLDTKTHTWFAPRVALGKGPKERAYHTTTRVGSTLFIFGGSTAEKAGESGILDDMPIFDLIRMAWDTRDVRGKKPRSRYMHSAALCEAKLIIFGGSDGRKSLIDVNVLDTDTMLWSQPSCGGSVPPGLQAHTCTLVDDRLYFVGGMTVSLDESEHSSIKYSADVYSLQCTSLEWNRLRRRGDAPTPRAYHATALVGGFLVLLGGWSGKAEGVNELSTLELDGFGSWAAVSVPGQAPANVYGHTATALGSNLVVFGGWDGVSPLAGVNVLDTASL